MANITGSIADAGRLIHLAKRRERQKEDLEKVKKKIEEETSAVHSFDDKFKAHYDAIETSLKSNTVGLVTLDEMRAKQEDYVRKRELQLSRKEIEAELRESEAEQKRRRLEEEQNQKRVLSFDPEDEEEDDSEIEQDQTPQSSSLQNDNIEDDGSGTSTEPTSTATVVLKKLGKDPTVDTSFLPDKEREEEENRLRETLRLEWAERQEKVKNEDINIAFSYWDGSGHRRDLVMKKGNTIGQFLQKAIEMLRPDFHELKTVSADSLMFVKEDLIIAHFHAFYDFIVTRAMGKTGPLFEFDAAGELRVRQDAARDVESHPAKVVLRSWYEKNKHIYPASRWEPFVPNKKYDRETDDLTQL